MYSEIGHYPKTSNIALKDLRPCDFCGQPLTRSIMGDGINNSPMFYQIEIKTVILNAGAINEQLGLAQMLGGSMRLAEVMGARGGEAAQVLEEPDAVTKLFQCQVCNMNAKKSISLAEVAERRHDKIREYQEGEDRAKEQASHQEQETEKQEWEERQAMLDGEDVVTSKVRIKRPSG